MMNRIGPEGFARGRLLKVVASLVGFVLLTVFTTACVRTGERDRPLGDAEGFSGAVPLDPENAQARCILSRKSASDYRLFCRAMIKTQDSPRIEASYIPPGVTASWSVSDGRPGGKIDVFGCENLDGGLRYECSVTSGNFVPVEAITVALTVSATTSGGPPRVSESYAEVINGAGLEAPLQGRVHLFPPAPLNTASSNEVIVSLYNQSNTSVSARAVAQLENASSGAVVFEHTEELSAPANRASAIRRALPPLVSGTYRLKTKVLDRQSGAVWYQETRTLGAISPVSGFQSTGLARVAWLSLGHILPGIIARTRASGEPIAHPNEYEGFLRQYVRGLAQMGFRSLVISYTEFLGYHFFQRLQFSVYDYGLARNTRYAGEAFKDQFSGTAATFDILEIILDEADRAGLAVMVGLGRGGDMNLMNDLSNAASLAPWERSQLDVRLAMNLSLNHFLSVNLHSAYGFHPSFQGWYIAHEANDLFAANRFYEPLAQHLKELTPEKAIVISPAGDPQRYGDMSEWIQNTLIDVISYQDSVGAGYSGLSLTYTFNPAIRLAELPSLFSRVRQWHSGVNQSRSRNFKQFWTNTEIWSMDGSCTARTDRYCGAVPASYERVNQQFVLAAQSADEVGFYDALGFLEPAGLPLKVASGRIGACDTCHLYSQKVTELSTRYLCAIGQGSCP